MNSLHGNALNEIKEFKERHNFRDTPKKSKFQAVQRKYF